MADVDFDCASIHFGLIKSAALMDSLSSLSSAFANTHISNSELTSLYLLDSSKTLIDSTMKSAVQEVQRRLTNSKNILINMDKEAELFFQYVGTGLLDENLVFTDVPYYNQLDYYNIPFANSNIGSCGCGYTSMCMALSYLENKILTPDLRAGEVDRACYNLESKMMKIAELEGVNVYKEEYVDYNKLRERLAEGKMCIVLVKDRSHFVLCKGVTDDGRVLVNDPYGKWASTAPYTEAQLQRGSSGMVWVIDPYKNVGAASTSIGQVKVSQSVLSEIQKANAGSGYVDITSSKYLKAIEKATGTKQSGNYKSLIGPNAVSLDGTDLSDRPKLENLSTNTGDTNTETTGDNSYYPYQLSSGNTTGEGSAAATKPASSTKPTQETIPENDNQVVEVATTQTEITESTAAQSTSGSTSYSVRTWSTKTSSPVTDRYVSTSLVKETTPASEGKTLSQTISEYTTLPKVESVAPSAKYTVSSEGTKPYIEAEPSSNNIDVSNMISAEEAVTPNTEIDINSIPTPGTEIEERINIKVDSESLIAKSPTPEYKYDLVRNNQIHSSSSGSDYSKYLGLAAGILGTLAVGTAAIALMKKTEEE